MVHFPFAPKLIATDSIYLGTIFLINYDISHQGQLIYKCPFFQVQYSLICLCQMSFLNAFHYFLIVQMYFIHFYCQRFTWRKELKIWSNSDSLILCTSFINFIVIMQLFYITEKKLINTIISSVSLTLCNI